MESDRKHFYVTFFGNASKELCPNNTLATFTIHLAQPIDLGSCTILEVDICEFTCQPPKPEPGPTVAFDVVGETNVLIYCDLIPLQFVGNDCVRLLRTFI